MKAERASASIVETPRNCITDTELVRFVSMLVGFLLVLVFSCGPLGSQGLRPLFDGMTAADLEQLYEEMAQEEMTHSLVTRTEDGEVVATPPYVATSPYVARPVKQPDVAAKQPDVATKQPDVATKQPDVATKQLDVVTKQSDVATK
ncbi:unnamed protein product [Closterium sp. Naga37s-1]|nr:unnamed protein product [Closterium sp. Naga37s-1]